jgi:dephospho-CoA kinase
MLKVGLTGGIACGKSYALKEFHKLGAYAIDADRIAHSVTEPGQPAYDEIVAAFGNEMLLEDGRLDRKKLGSLIFSNGAERKKLNSIVHPYILKEEQRLIAEAEKDPRLLRSPVVMVDAALMVEVGSYRNYDFVIVVYCHPSIQLSRLVTREGLSEEEAWHRISSQMPLLEKVRYADYVIENSGKLSHTHRQIKQVFAELINYYDELRVL